jgi:hypothetical protein
VTANMFVHACTATNGQHPYIIIELRPFYL